MTKRTAADWMRWYNETMAGNPQPIHSDDPQPGWFKVRMVRLGPWLPARIFVDHGELRCKVGDAEHDPAEWWSRLAARPISHDEYMRLYQHWKTDPKRQADLAPYDLTREPTRP